jgi:hypothetical protein
MGSHKKFKLRLERNIKIMTIIEKEMVDLLIDNGVLKNTHNGIVGKDDMPVGYMKTVHKRYIEDDYAIIANELVRKSNDNKKSKRE